MSYTVYPYLVDLARLQAVYGSKDDALAQDIEGRFAEEFAAQDNEFIEERGAPTLPEAMRELLAGEVRQLEQAWQYGYALELLCRYLGTPLPNDHCEALWSKSIGVIAALDGLRELNEGSRMPLPIPAPEDFPVITYLTAAEAADRLARFQPLAVPEPDWQEWATNVQEQYRSWLQEAVRTQRGVVAFLY